MDNTNRNRTRKLPGKLPTVTRWPYDYGKGGKDFISQVAPVEDWEKEYDEAH